MYVPDFLPVLLVVAVVLIFWMRGRGRRADAGALLYRGAAPSFTTRGWLHISREIIYTEHFYGESGIKFMLGLHEQQAVLRVVIQNKAEDVLNIPFAEIERVEYLVTPKNYQILAIELESSVQVGSGEMDTLVLTFRDGNPGAYDVHHKLRDLLGPDTTFTFQRTSDRDIVEQGRGPSPSP